MAQEFLMGTEGLNADAGGPLDDNGSEDAPDIDMNVDAWEVGEEDEEEESGGEGSEADSEEESEGDDKVEERKVLPERASRGKRYSQLIGEEEEKDAQFWGHNTWEEEEEDSGWSSEDEKVELEMLGAEDSETESEQDSQSDDGAEDMEVVQEEDDDVIDGRKAKRPKTMAGGKYKDPSLFLKSAQKDLLKKAKKKKSSVKTGTVKRTPAIVEPRTMSMRASTSQKKQDLQEMIRRRDEEAQDKARRRVKRPSDSRREARTVMTQEERLEACKEVEKMNIESLNQLEAFEEHRRYLDNSSASMRKQLQSGPLSIYISWSSYRLMESEKDKSDQILNSDEYCREMIIYTGGDIPPHINQRKDPNADLGVGSEGFRPAPRCSVYGVPAKYLDPLTNKYYSSLEAFKIIRKEYHTEKYREIFSEMREVQDLISESKKLIGEDTQGGQISHRSYVKVE
ncbi:hypothetical protein OJ253_1850 [Cryptosporidium canis]|uniref:Vps72/YL1 C-terminal domain-containing protein n=1 Tax=Cryptosporidium canis TaxID=195482 RepID=A0A9D5HV67_9CRYT|nr:hypothetical protein OJ253_1850 [Cryptosporidium canis]